MALIVICKPVSFWPAAITSRTAISVRLKKSCAGSSSPSIKRVTFSRIALRIVLAACREIIQDDPPALPLHLDLHDRVDFPDGAARLSDLIGMFRVHHRPAA